MNNRIGICTCYDTKNYGSMLQAYATQIVIDELGYKSEFIIYKKKKTITFLIKQLPRILNGNLINDKMLKIKKSIQIQRYPAVVKNEKIRQHCFESFQKKYYKHFSPVYYGYSELKKGAQRYNAVVVGSDQLWTPGGLASNFYNLMFVPDEINKVSYATSFGVAHIPWYQVKRTKKYLMRINNISVREIRGAEIVKELTNKEAEVVLDPTMLLDTSKWNCLIENKQIINEPYIFCYFLGENQEHREAARVLSKSTNLKIVCTPFLDSFVKSDLSFGDFCLFDIGPDDFINLIRNANYVLTDSFHCTVFSLLYEKNFVVFDRFEKGANSRNSRIDSLCNITGTSGRRYNGNIYHNIKEDIDFEMVNKVIESFRKKSLNYLEKSLHK